MAILDNTQEAPPGGCRDLVPADMRRHATRAYGTAMSAAGDPDAVLQIPLDEKNQVFVTLAADGAAWMERESGSLGSLGLFATPRTDSRPAPRETLLAYRHIFDFQRLAKHPSEVLALRVREDLALLLGAHCIVSLAASRQVFDEAAEALIALHLKPGQSARVLFSIDSALSLALQPLIIPAPDRDSLTCLREDLDRLARLFSLARNPRILQVGTGFYEENLTLVIGPVEAPGPRRGRQLQKLLVLTSGLAPQDQVRDFQQRLLGRFA